MSSISGKRTVKKSRNFSTICLLALYLYRLSLAFQFMLINSTNDAILFQNIDN
ncbi:hypothetical protein HMPREF0476_1116 [Kingella kingae ATCC 23330]|uniref:Uncharacterized protein n=1 Tax=Kingella kingae ATCC 23330 TaxID=887327 RepID=F5S7D3_KINKI|nr:hypothetical protein HMPREF0476_1116 [Kingella kingae ATCC 23330]